MVLSDIKGNYRIISRLRQAVRSGNVSHAYMFTGSDEEERFSFAKCFIKEILCENGGCDECVTCRKIENDNYTDIYYAAPAEGKKLLDAQIEEIQYKLRNRPLEGNRNIAVISSADTMTTRAQNRFLKTLEEPAPGTVILLLADSAEGFLPTIRSRCAIYRLEEKGAEYDSKAAENASQLIQMFAEEAPFYLQKSLVEKIAKDRQEAMNTLDCLEIALKDMLLKGDRTFSAEEIYDSIEVIEDVKGRITRNVKTSSALKYMMLKIGGI